MYLVSDSIRPSVSQQVI